MKKITAILGLIAMVAFQSCEGPIGPIGPEGPQGPQGPQGQPGVNIVSEVFQLDVDFTEANNFEVIRNFNPPIVESDIVLAFIRWETTGSTGQIPVWRPLPQTVFFEEGVLMYNFDFTRNDFRIFLDGPIDYRTLDADWTRGQRFRVVVVPGDFAGARIDWTNYDAVVKLLGIEEEDFLKSDLSLQD